MSPPHRQPQGESHPIGRIRSTDPTGPAKPIEPEVGDQRQAVDAHRPLRFTPPTGPLSDSQAAGILRRSRPTSVCEGQSRKCSCSPGSARRVLVDREQSAMASREGLETRRRRRRFGTATGADRTRIGHPACRWFTRRSWCSRKIHLRRCSRSSIRYRRLQTVPVTGTVPRERRPRLDSVVDTPPPQAHL